MRKSIRLVLISLFTICSYSSIAQDGAVKDEEPTYEIFAVSEPAKFKNGGEKGLMQYIAENVEYPKEAMDSNIMGTVIVSFVVDTSGNVIDIKTLNKPLGYGLEEEAIRVMQNTSGMWEPALQRDKKVKMRFRQPIRFTLY